MQGRHKQGSELELRDVEALQEKRRSLTGHSKRKRPEADAGLGLSVVCRAYCTGTS